MPRSHILVEALHGSNTRELAELLVHVVRARARVVAQPDTEVLDLERALLVDLSPPHKIIAQNQTISSSALNSETRDTHDIDPYDLTAGLLRLLSLPEEVPEAGLGDDFVGREEAHAVQLGGAVRRGGQMPPDDLVFLERHFVLGLGDL